MRFYSVILLAAISFSCVACGGGGGSTIVTPPPPPTHNVWTWMGGANSANQTGTYGTLGAPSAGNTPGARANAAISQDASSGTVWLSGGIDYQGNLYNDLWKYSAGEGTWMSGSKVPSQAGIYGTLGASDPNNVPGARYGASAWIDSSGSFWLFAGAGLDSVGGAGGLSDLWKYSSGQWTWVGGSNLANQPVGVYGTVGIASPNNFPPGRFGALSWTDKSGNFWLFAGTRYGTQGQASSTNIPGARSGAVSWRDSSGNVWLFGGFGYDSNGTLGGLSDLWKYQP